MSVRRRAIKTRLARKKRHRDEYEAFSRTIHKLLEDVRRIQARSADTRDPL